MHTHVISTKQKTKYRGYKIALIHVKEGEKEHLLMDIYPEGFLKVKSPSPSITVFPFCTSLRPFMASHWEPQYKTFLEASLHSVFVKL